jgi:20S proteasome alpha/beta subunit
MSQRTVSAYRPAMTLLVALRGTDGIALASDSRGTFGDLRGVTAQNDTMIKAHIIASQAAVLHAGAGEVGSLLLQEFAQANPPASLPGATDAMNKLREFARGKYQEWFPSLQAIPPPALVQAGQVAGRPDLVYIVAGHDAGGDGELSPQIYQLASTNDFAPALHNYGFAVAGIAQYALYLLNRLYEADRTVAELLPLAAYVITETASQDGKVGGPVQMIRVMRDADAAILTADDVKTILSQNETRSQILRSSFFQPPENKEEE